MGSNPTPATKIIIVIISQSLKILAIVLLFCGEAVGIYSEVISAKFFASNQPFVRALFAGLLIFMVCGLLLISGYMVGFRAFKNIWVVSVISTVAILIIEPLLDYSIFNQLPTRGAVVGLILGIFGFIATIFYK